MLTSGLTFFVLLSFLSCASVRGAVTQPIDQICLGCICEAASQCRGNTCEGDSCGVFKITWSFWADAGKPVLENSNPNDNDAYAKCTTDNVCAARTVQKYVEKFAQDCNGDGVIDCYDYASLHRNGAYRCKEPTESTYNNRFNTCMQQVRQLGG